MRWHARNALAVVAALALAAGPAGAAERVAIGSKAFPESWILAEALAQRARATGADVNLRPNLGGTEIVFAALRDGAIDIYPEYTGTISEVILKTGGRPSLETMRRALAAQGIVMGKPLGFNDGYALAVTRATAERLGLHKISDLAKHPELRYGFTHEFIGRADGFAGLARRYGLEHADVRGIQHELAYEAIASGSIDVMDIYTTDAQIQNLGLVALDDDLGFFPRYDAVLLYRADLGARAPLALAAMRAIEGRIDETAMTRANARVVLKKESAASAAAALLAETVGAASKAASGSRPVMRDIARYTAQHLRLVGISLAAAILIGVPLGVMATRAPALAAVTLAGTGVLQTLPSLALLAFLIPLFGIGVVPALIALFLYSLLPIVRNTYTGITGIPPPLMEAAQALGLSRRAHLMKVVLPMAAPSIMAGIKTSAVINVGTATLAALIGAGGLGDPILAGIQLRQHGLILEGAVPAAVLALLVQWSFDLLDRVVVPRGLRLRPAEEP